MEEIKKAISDSERFLRHCDAGAYIVDAGLKQLLLNQLVIMRQIVKDLGSCDSPLYDREDLIEVTTHGDRRRRFIRGTQD